MPEMPGASDLRSLTPSLEVSLDRVPLGVSLPDPDQHDVDMEGCGF